MPWQEVSAMTLRGEFVALAQQEGANRRALCRRFGISPTTGYKWLRRYQAQGHAGLQDRSRRPRHRPRHTPPAVEQAGCAGVRLPAQCQHDDRHPASPRGPGRTSTSRSRLATL